MESYLAAVGRRIVRIRGHYVRTAIVEASWNRLEPG